MRRLPRPPGAGPRERDPTGATTGPPFLPDEVLPFSAALWLYTIGGAYAAGKEMSLGSLSRGYRADFVVLDRVVWDDPSGVALLNATVLSTFVNGRKCWHSSQLSYLGGGVTTDPTSAGANGPRRRPATVGAFGCPCCRIARSRSRRSAAAAAQGLNVGLSTSMMMMRGETDYVDTDDVVTWMQLRPTAGSAADNIEHQGTSFLSPSSHSPPDMKRGTQQRSAE
uniref:Amidohydrolase 3 domain-containing protein n=1 Tax=Rhizochromulina marina TaxID=1034831 RepID=A0A7S2WU53_9STRA|mmetsp:Transcript_5619/g.16533  ORF Transcript_5619/g.16533 Transcript_5619/m.16533 type:complete len:224 (+) Transcript_5619:251-922(+)